jgi:hypothetical protein
LAVCSEVYGREDRTGLRIFQSVVDPADQVTVSNVTDKEKKAVSGLVEAAVPQPMEGQRAGIEVLGFRATETALVISATVKMPIGPKERAR